VEFDVLGKEAAVAAFFCLGVFTFYVVVVVGRGQFSCPYQYIFV